MFAHYFCLAREREGNLHSVAPKDAEFHDLDAEASRLGESLRIHLTGLNNAIEAVRGTIPPKYVFPRHHETDNSNASSSSSSLPEETETEQEEPEAIQKTDRPSTPPWFQQVQCDNGNTIDGEPTPEENEEMEKFMQDFRRNLAERNTADCSGRTEDGSDDEWE